MLWMNRHPIKREVSIVKMYAEERATKSSNKLIKSAKNTEIGETRILLSMKIILIKERMTICPAVMFANNRMHRAKGFVNCPMISTGIIMGKSIWESREEIRFCR